jgi:hypothetical protein
VPQAQHTGSWATPSFTTGSGTWTIGWAYACSRVTTGPPFQIYVVTSGAEAPKPVVEAPSLSGSGTTQVASPGEHSLQIEANPFCTSAAKVVGPKP